MIVLKILLWILLALIGLIIVVCILPVGGEVSYIDGKLSYKVKLWLLNVMDSEGGGLLGWLKKRKAKKKPKPPKPAKDKKKKKSKKEEKPVPAAPAEELTAEYTPPDTATEVTEEAAEVASADEVTADELSPEDLVALDEITNAETLADTGDSGKKKKKEKKKKSKKKKEPEETYYEFEDSDDEEDEDDEPKKSLGDKIGFLIDIWHSAKRPLRTVLKGFKFSDVYIDFLIADEDAYKCAINYGRFSGIIFNGIRMFSNLFTVRLKTVDVRPGFGTRSGKWDAAAKLRFRLGTAVIAGVWFLITFIFRVFIPGKLKARKARKLKKAAAAQK